VARYYARIGEWIVPHVAGRPLTLVRCPEGIRGDCFFMKHSKVWAPKTLRRVHIKEKKKVGDYLIADDLPGVVGLVQMGVLEIHTWNSDIARVEQPNRIVFDLDPGDAVRWARVVEGARAVREALRALGLESFVKTTGGAGLHSTEFAKANRRNRILIDYLRNNRTNTSVAAYSTRARADATVSVPLTWKELTTSLDPGAFTVQTVPRRLAKLRADPWAGYWRTKQKLTRPIVAGVGL
jgi:bifunctional non-homologous end joining protein LigD